MQVVCGVQDADDPAIHEVRKLGDAVELAIDPSEHGRNRKVSNLVNMLALARHDILIIADSDIEVGPEYVSDVVGHLQRPGVGAVTCLYHGVAAGGVWSRQAALGINTHFLPNVAAALRFGLARPCFGSTIALRGRALARIGGLQSFADCLADDYAIGDAVRSAGFQVAIPSFSIAHVCFERSLGSLFAHELRSARTLRSIAPIGHFGAIVTHPFPLALIAGLSGGGEGFWLAAVALACRGLLCLCVENAFDLERQPYWLIPFRDTAFLRGVRRELPRQHGELARVRISRHRRRKADPSWKASDLMRTLFLQAPSWEGFDDGAGSRYQARREIRSFWYPAWLAQAAPLAPDSRLIDAPLHGIELAAIVNEARDYELAVLQTSSPSFAGDVRVLEALKAANPSVKAGFVGAKVAVEPDASLAASPLIDFVAGAENDFTIRELAEGRDWGRIRELTYRGPSGAMCLAKSSRIWTDCPS